MSADRTEVGQLYVRTWAVVLGNLLGWPPDRVERWARRHEAGLSGRDPWFTHRNELDYISYLFVPRSVRARVQGLDLLRFCWRIERAIMSQGSDVAGSHYNWQIARDRINAILGEYGESLDRVISELGEDGELHWRL
jgi:hypothetical protein